MFDENREYEFEKWSVNEWNDFKDHYNNLVKKPYQVESICRLKDWVYCAVEHFSDRANGRIELRSHETKFNETHIIDFRFAIIKKNE